MINLINLSLKGYCATVQYIISFLDKGATCVSAKYKIFNWRPCFSKNNKQEKLSVDSLASPTDQSQNIDIDMTRELAEIEGRAREQKKNVNEWER